MKNLASLMKQASQMQAKVEELQARLQTLTVEGASGAGMVNVTLTAKGEVRAITLDPKIVDPNDIELLQDLIMAAFDDARQKADAVNQEEMRKVTGGLDLPAGLKLPF